MSTYKGGKRMPSHKGTPRPGNPGYRSGRYDGKHEGGGCLSVVVATAITLFVALAGAITWLTN